MRPFTFLQLSDLHLDSDLSSSALQYPDSVVKQIGENQREAVAAAIHEAARRRVDAIFMPGDLWDGESVRQDTVFWLMDLFRSVSPIPVYIAPGNHDSYHQNSPYHPHYSNMRGVTGWSENVVIFRSERCETVVHPFRSDVTISGMATIPMAANSDRLLGTQLKSREAGAISILLFHGSREMEGVPRGKMSEAPPFNDHELVSQKFSYVALGHYHRKAVITNSDGGVVAAYSGIPCGRTLSETGKKGVLFGICTENGLRQEHLEEVSFSKHVIEKIEVDVTQLTHKAAVVEKVEAAIRDLGLGIRDILYIVVGGTYGACEVPDISPGDLEISSLHLVVDQRIRPGYDLNAYLNEGAVETIEKRLVKEMQKRIAAATSDEERNILEAALYYGLDALVQGRCETLYARYFHG